MFINSYVALALALMYAAGGAVLGALLGWVSSELLRLQPRRGWLDAAMGAGGILALYLLIVIAAHGAKIVDDRTLGWRGLLLNHLIAWALGLVCLAVVGRQLVMARGRRPSRNGSSSEVGVRPH